MIRCSYSEPPSARTSVRHFLALSPPLKVDIDQMLEFLRLVEPPPALDVERNRQNIFVLGIELDHALDRVVQDPRSRQIVRLDYLKAPSIALNTLNWISHLVHPPIKRS